MGLLHQTIMHNKSKSLGDNKTIKLSTQRTPKTPLQDVISSVSIGLCYKTHKAPQIGIPQTGFAMSGRSIIKCLKWYLVICEMSLFCLQTNKTVWETSFLSNKQKFRRNVSCESPCLAAPIDTAEHELNLNRVKCAAIAGIQCVRCVAQWKKMVEPLLREHDTCGEHVCLICVCWCCVFFSIESLFHCSRTDSRSFSLPDLCLYSSGRQRSYAGSIVELESAREKYYEWRHLLWSLLLLVFFRCNESLE